MPIYSGHTFANYFPVELQKPWQVHGLPTCTHEKKHNPLKAKWHCRSLSLNICGWIMITTFQLQWSISYFLAALIHFLVDSAGCRSCAAFTSCWKKWKSGITFTCLTWTVFMCLTCYSQAKLCLMISFKSTRNARQPSLFSGAWLLWMRLILIFWFPDWCSLVANH